VPPVPPLDLDHPAKLWVAFVFKKVVSPCSNAAIGMIVFWTPMVLRGNPVSWESAVGTVVDKNLHKLWTRSRTRLRIRFYLSGQILTEDYYVANKLAKVFIVTRPIVDTNSRLCMRCSVGTTSVGLCTVPL